MPIPTKNPGEKESAFISRCMGNESMLKDYPDQKQRAGICFSQWRKDAEASTKSWAAVDKSKLPKSCFLWIEGDGETKAQWHLPVYEGAGGIDPDTGMYRERGPVNLQALRSAAAAIGGARTGKPMDVPASVKSKLQSLMKAQGIGEKKKDRYDISIREDKFKITPQGFLIADATVTRTGVFDYSGIGGVKEFRSEEEVFNEDSMESLKLIPVTLKHPSEMVSVDNVKELQIGTTGDMIHRDGDFLACRLVITDKNLVKEIQDRHDTGLGNYEISLGYKCDVDPIPGEFNGETYDAIQSNIQYNHLSLVATGRAGRDARLRLDKKEEIVMFKFKRDKIETPSLHMDAIDIEIPNEATSVVEKLSDKLDEAVEIVDYLSKMGDAIQARYDALVEESGKVKKDLEDWQNPTSDKVQNMLKERKDLEDLAGKLKVEHKDKDDKTLKLDIIKAVSKDFDPKDKSDEYVQARFDTIREAMKKTDAGDTSMAKFITTATELKADAGEQIDHRDAFIKRSQALHKEKPAEQTAAK